GGAAPPEGGVVVGVHVVHGLRDGDGPVAGERGDDAPRVGGGTGAEERALTRDAERVGADHAGGRVAAESVARSVEEERDARIAVQVVVGIDLAGAVPLDLV